MSELLKEAHTLARELRRRASPPAIAIGSNDRLLVQRLNVSHNLVLRCADLILALDTATERESSRKRKPAGRKYAVLDVSRLTAQGLLNGRSCEGRIGIAKQGLIHPYELRRINEDRYDLVLGPNDKTVEIVSTRPRFGGVRFWLSCPACGRRVLRLYLPDGNLTPACRECHRIPYGNGNADTTIAFDAFPA